MTKVVNQIAGLRDGQSYFDEPIFAQPKGIAVSVCQALRIAAPTPVLIGHERIRYRWMKPDGKGGLVPR